MTAEDDHRVFWADEVADEIEARAPDEPIVIKGGISPSGVPHLGNMNEVMRGHFVAEVLRERGHSVRQVFTADDRDPLRGLPRTLAALDGTLVGLGDVDAGALGRNLGVPYTDIADPFGCCDSYGDHFSRLIQRGADALEVEIDLLSTTALYEDGTLEAQTRQALERRDRVRSILSEFQAKVDADYVPFNPICANCGTVTETVTDIDLDAGTVAYRCTDLEAGGETIEGCGHEGTASLREGKLPWRLEWPAQWASLEVDFEPFGKDHAEGSWPSGQALASEIFDTAPPVPLAYEWFTLDGEPFSSSAGNVILVSDVLELIEPEVLRFFFAKDPGRARDFSIERLDLLVDEFDRFEAIYFGEVEGTPDEQAYAERVYPLVVPAIDEDRVRLPYTFAAVLGMTADPEVREQIARKQGHLPDDASQATVETALARVERARTWAQRTDNEFAYELKRTTIPDHSFDPSMVAALDELADYVEAGHDGEAIQGEMYEIARRHDLEVSSFFAAGYRLFFDGEEGPRLGEFLGKLERDFVVDRLRRER
ncbi:MAG: lysine--tRNA ligase [Natrialbaceae archaeon]|nr:lysine--tRNA ligase [Natrialbaceae archaeon]